MRNLWNRRKFELTRPMKAVKLPLFAKGNADVLSKFAERRKIRSEIWRLLRTTYKFLLGAVLLAKRSLFVRCTGRSILQEPFSETDLSAGDVERPPVERG